MVNQLLSKLLSRELKHNWFQYLSMFAIILLAVTLFLGFVSNTLTLRTRTDRYIEESNLADYVLQMGKTDDNLFTPVLTDSDRSFFASLKTTQPVEYRIYSDGEFTIAGKGSSNAKFYLSDGSINVPYLVEGKEGFLIDKCVADLFGYAVGDRVEVTFTTFAPYFEALSIETLSFEVTGLMHSIEGVNIFETSPVFLTSDYFYDTVINIEGAKELIQLIGWEKDDFVRLAQNQVLIKCKDADFTKKSIDRYFNAKEKNNLLFTFDRETTESVVVLDNEAEQSLNMIYVFPVIFFLVAILVMTTTIGRFVLRERTNIGTMKALGISNFKILLLYASLSAIVTFLGAVVGAIIGPLIVTTVMNIKYGLIYSMPMLSGIRYSIPWTVGTVLFVTAVSLGIGMWSSRTILKENPSECMRPKQTHYRPHGSAKTVKSNDTTALSFRMAFRNIRMNKRRALMTIAGIMGCTALLITSFGIGDTIDSSVHNDYGNLFTYDVAGTYSAAKQEEMFSELEAWKASGTITAYETVRTYAVTASTSDSSRTVSVYIQSKDTVMSKIPANKNVMSRKTADQLGVDAGDTVTFTSGGCTVEYQIEEIVVTAARNGFYTSEDKFHDCFSIDSLWVTGENPDAIAERLSSLDGVDSVRTMESYLTEIGNLTSTVKTMQYTLMTFAIALSVVVLYNLSLLNMKERNRDMATLKVLGFTNGKIALSLFVEVVALTVFGTALGACLGYPLMYLVMKINELATIAFVYSLSFRSYLISVCISVGTSVVINFLFGRFIKKIDMTQSLKSVE